MVRRDTPGAQRFFLARVNAALRADSRRLRVAAPLRAAARRFRVIAAFWPGVSLALGLAFMGSLPLRSSVMLRPPSHEGGEGAESKTMRDELHKARSSRLHGEVAQ